MHARRHTLLYFKHHSHHCTTEFNDVTQNELSLLIKADLTPYFLRGIAYSKVDTEIQADVPIYSTDGCRRNSQAGISRAHIHWYVHYRSYCQAGGTDPPSSATVSTVGTKTDPVDVRSNRGQGLPNPVRTLATPTHIHTCRHT